MGLGGQLVLYFGSLETPGDGSPLLKYSQYYVCIFFNVYSGVWTWEAGLVSLYTQGCLCQCM